MWNASQRAVVLVIAIGVLSYLTIRFSFQHQYIADPQPPEGVRAQEVDNRFDPNTATKAELAAIPNIGEKLAAAVIEFRERYQAEHPGQIAFVQLKDLRKVRGVGPAKMEAFSEYLIFPTTHP